MMGVDTPPSEYTDVELRRAAIIAEAALYIDVQFINGLLAIAPVVNHERCLAMIEEADRRGIERHPSSVTGAALGMVRELHHEREEARRVHG